MECRSASSADSAAALADASALRMDRRASTAHAMLTTIAMQLTIMEMIPISPPKSQPAPG
ncbi:hypothetical protein Aph01nite_76940 [Acrocarpospora phusangensis]|uniref:Uncharacterized protein n=1 Tax=Acrocarpospora phusangensis TaxID=1070424 RepID=A0A919QHX8_9ACTN|nr:hypothetical protein Aph01nite_76940 [Acrocarpospora phusangensis]